MKTDSPGPREIADRQPQLKLAIDDLDPLILVVVEVARPRPHLFNGWPRAS